MLGLPACRLSNRKDQMPAMSAPASPSPQEGREEMITRLLLLAIIAVTVAGCGVVLMEGLINPGPVARKM